MPSWPLVEVALEPRSAADAAPLNAALARLSASDAQLSVCRDQESGGALLGAKDEDHFEGAIASLREDVRFQFNIGAPVVAYRELLGRGVCIDYFHKLKLGPAFEFAKVVIDFAPAVSGAGFTFENQASGAIPNAFAASVEKGLEIARQNGVRAGFPLIDFKATLVDAAFHVANSTPRAFQAAAQGALHALKDRGDVQVAEPYMTIEVISPEAFIARIISDLNARRGVIQERRTGAETTTILAVAPLADLFGYANGLRSISQGSATHAVQFLDYRTIPPSGGDPPFPPAVEMRT